MKTLFFVAFALLVQLRVLYHRRSEHEATPAQLRNDDFLLILFFTKKKSYRDLFYYFLEKVAQN